MGKSKKHNPDENSGANLVPDGLVKSRSCTDVICLFVFAIFLIAWLVVGVFAFKDGHPDDIFAPFDSNNKRCGIDEEVKDRPYLFYFDLTDCLPRPGNVLKCHTPQVCVTKCPSDNFYADYFLTERDERKLPFVVSKLVCRDGFDVTKLRSLNDVRNAVEDEQCSRWYLESRPFANRCLPRQLSAIQDAADGINIDVIIDNTGKTVSNVITGVNGQHITNATGIVRDFAAVNEYGEAILKDLKNNWRWIVLLIGISTLVSLIYIVIMRWITSIMVWFSLLGCVGLFSFCIYYTWTRYDELKKSEEGLKRLSRDSQDQSPVDELLENKDTWMAFFILSIIALVIILCILIFLRKRIRIAVALINEGSKAVASSWTTIIFPIFPWICQVIVFAYGFAILVFLLATGVPIYKATGVDNSCVCSNIYPNGSLCEPTVFDLTCNKNSENCETARCQFSETETKNYAIYFHLFNVFMVFWGSFFVSGFGDMVLASTFSKYYWTFNKNNLPFFMVAGSVYEVIRYHLGTIAIGSFLLALCNWIRWVIRQAHNQLNKTNNPVLKGIHCCCQCFFWCLEKFLKFLSKNAYIMCAMRGKNFCVSARKAFNLILRNVLRYAVLDGVTGYIFLLNKLLITAMVGAIAFYVFANPLPDLQDINSTDTYQTKYFYVPIIIVCVIAFFIASLFFSVYDMAVDTLFLCFLVDSEKNDGTPEKPYFMSKELMKILGKKNKKLN